ncbi:hypothetical protein [Ekhidna sp.]
MKSITKVYTIIFCFWFPFSAISQISGEVNYEKLGIAFEIPKGWYGQESEEMLIMQSNSTSGYLLMQAHEFTLSQLKDEAKKGIVDNNGTSLKLEGDLDIGPNYVGGIFSGTMEWEPVKSYLVGVINPKGLGVMIMGVTSPNQYDEVYRKLCFEIYDSFKFTEVDRTSEYEEWKEWLSDSRLTYMNSNYSTDYSPGGISGGYSSTRKIDLCSKGYFSDYSYSDMSISGDNVSGYSTNEGEGAGSWRLEMDGYGSFTLILSYNSGEDEVYDLDYRDGKFYMNDTRYFVTSEGEYAPDCR